MSDATKLAKDADRAKDDGEAESTDKTRSDLSGDPVTAALEAKKKERVFLVVADDSEEMPVALRYAGLRAKKTGGKIALLYVQEPADFHHWLGVGELMQQEAREEAERKLQELSAIAHEISGTMPVLYVREGDRAEELFKLLDEEKSISIVVLAASAGGGGPGPIISYIMGKGGSRIRTPFTIVPGSLTQEEIETLS